MPVVAPAVELIDWSPVVAFVVLVTDWSPVLVVLSIVRLERPRRSMFGVKVEVDPVTAESVLALEPVIAELTLVLEPVTEGLLVALLAELAEVRFAELAEVVPAADGFGVMDADGLLVEVVLAWESGVQSWCTGLLERSFAMPVSFPASFPAWGCPNSLQSGLVAAAVVPLVEDLAVASAAKAGLAAPNTAATASALI